VTGLRIFLARLLGLVGGDARRELELRAEIDAHIAEATEEFERQGVPADEARRLAFARFGGVTQTMEVHRDRRRFRPFGSFGQDLAYGARMLVRSLGFTLVALLTLTIGILATTTVFSAVNAVLFRPLAIEEPAEVLQIFNGSSQDQQNSAKHSTFLQRPPGRAMTLIVKVASAGELNAIAEAVRKSIQQVDPIMPIAEIRKGEDHAARELGAVRLTAEVAMLLGLVALTLASLGLYGVISYAVSVRAREIGIRLALGARSANVRALIIRQGMLLTAVGLAAGLGASLLATPVLQSRLINLPATDPVTFAGVSALLLAIALVACYVRGARRESIRLPPFAPSRSPCDHTW
jgi:FtsX-like permease family